MRGIFPPIALLLAALLAAALARPASAEVWTAEQARAALAAGEAILVDIRSEGEWKETGVAEGAWPVSMHDPAFGRNLQRLMEIRGARTVALICATGGRSAHVLGVLEAYGVEGFVDVSEGMLGSEAGPGWIKRGYPVVPLEAARRRMAEEAGL